MLHSHLRILFNYLILLDKNMIEITSHTIICTVDSRVL